MDSDAEAEIGDAAARLSLIVDEAYRRNASRLLHEDVIALAALVDAAGVRDLGDGRLAVRPHALIPALCYHFLVGVLSGSNESYERSSHLRVTLNVVAEVRSDLSEAAAELRNHHGALLDQVAAAHYLSHVPGCDDGHLDRAGQLARWGMGLSPGTPTWRSAVRTFLAVAKTSSEEGGDAVLLEEAIELGRSQFRRIAEPGAVIDDVDVDLLSNFGACLRARNELMEDDESLTEAVNVLTMAIRIGSGRPGEALARLNLSQAMYVLADSQDDPAVAQEAFAHVFLAARMVGPSDWQRHRYLRALGDGWMRRADDEPEAPLKAARAYAEALRTAPEDRRGLLVSLADSVHRAYVTDLADPAPIELISSVREMIHDGWVADGLFAEHLANAVAAGEDQAQLDVALEHAQSCTELSGRHPSMLTLLGFSLAQRFHHTSLAADGERAASVLREAVEASTDATTTIQNACHLASVVNRIYSLADDIALPDSYLGTLRTVQEAMPGPNTDKALAMSLSARFRRLRNPTDRAEAIALLRGVLQVTPEDAQSLRQLWSLLVSRNDEAEPSAEDAAEALEVAWKLRRGDPAEPEHLELLVTTALVAGAFQEHIDALRGVLDELHLHLPGPPWNPEQLHTLISKVHLLELVFEETGDGQALTEAIGLARQLAEQPVLSPTMQTEARTALAQALLRRFEFNGSRAELEEAIALLRVGAENSSDADRRSHGLPAGELDADLHAGTGFSLAQQRLALGTGLTDQYVITGAVADLDDAVTLFTRVLEDPPADARATALGNLGLALQLRAQHHRDPDDRRRAYEACRNAVTLTPPGHRERPRRLIQLATAAMALARSQEGGAEQTRAWADLAVTAAREALATAPDGHSEELRYMQALAMALLIRQETAADDVDFAEAMHTYAHVVDSTEPGHTQHAVALLNLAEAHLRRGAGADGSDGALESAASYARRAAASEEAGWSHHAQARILLSRALQALAQGTDRAVYIREAAGHLRDAAQAPTGPPDHRLEAAVRWAALEEEAQRWHKALQAWATAVELLPIAVWFGLDRALREAHLRRYEGVARQAGAAALDAGRPDSAVIFLEQGRNVLWAGLLRTRTSLDDVRATHPELAQALEDVRGRLDALDRAAELAAHTLRPGPKDV